MRAEARSSRREYLGKAHNQNQYQNQLIPAETVKAVLVVERDPGCGLRVSRARGEIPLGSVVGERCVQALCRAMPGWSSAEWESKGAAAARVASGQTAFLRLTLSGPPSTGAGTSGG